MTRQNNISSCIQNALQAYFMNLDGEKPTDVYAMVLESVERPMLTVVLEQTGGNQTLAAKMLGINRNTLRKKMAEYGLL